MSARYDFHIDQGTTWITTLTYKNNEGNPVDLTGFSARMHVRPSVEASKILLNLTTENGKIQINGPTGELTITLEPEDTSNLGFVRKGVYDLELISPAPERVVMRLLEGNVYFNTEVTRE